MRVLELKGLTADEIDALCKRPKLDFDDALQRIQPILTAVREKGDAAVREYTEKFDKAVLADVVIDLKKLPAADKKRVDAIPANVKAAFDQVGWTAQLRRLELSDTLEHAASARWGQP
jgi:histidinol dehydrogenase